MKTIYFNYLNFNQFDMLRLTKNYFQLSILFFEQMLIKTKYIIIGINFLKSNN